MSSWPRSASRQGMVRISVGLEDVDDLLADMARALVAAMEAGPSA